MVKVTTKLERGGKQVDAVCVAPSAWEAMQQIDTTNPGCKVLTVLVDNAAKEQVRNVTYAKTLFEAAVVIE